MVEHFKITLLSPLFYYTRTESGVASTSPFIGDLALTYATNFAFCKDRKLTYLMREKPEYEELKRLGFLWSVARPLNFRRTRIFANSSSFGNDGARSFSTLVALKGGGAQPLYKDFRLVQGIEGGSTFQASLLGDLELPERFTLRVGNGRECLLLLERVDKLEKDAWMNLYTLKLFGEELEVREGLTFEPVLAQYILVKGLEEEDLERLERRLFGCGR